MGEKAFAAVGALFVVLIGVAAIIFANKPSPPINVYIDKDGRQYEPAVPQPQPHYVYPNVMPYRPLPTYPHRPGNLDAGSKGSKEEDKST